MIKLHEMLKCGLCHDRFDIADRKPLTLSKCGHTFCKHCLSFKADDISVTSCPYKCFPSVDHEPVATVPNYSIINLLDNITELNFNFFKPSFEQGLSIDSYCILHEKVTKEYDYIEQRFKCVNCQASGINSTINLKTLVDDYTAVVDYTKTIFKINKLQLNHIEKLGDKAEALRANAMKATLGQAIEYMDKAFEAKKIEKDTYQEFCYMKNRFVKKLELHLNMLSGMCEDYNSTLRNIEENERVCAFIAERDYDLNALPCTGIYLKPFKPAAYFLNKAKGIGKYAENQIMKFSRKFVLRFLKLYKAEFEAERWTDKQPVNLFRSNLIMSEIDEPQVKEIDNVAANSTEHDANQTEHKPRSKYGLRKRIKKF